MNFSMNNRSPKSKFLWNRSTGARSNSSEILKTHKIDAIWTVNNHKVNTLYLTSLTVFSTPAICEAAKYSLFSLLVDFCWVYHKFVTSAFESLHHHYFESYHSQCFYSHLHVHQRPLSIWFANILYFLICIIPFRPCNGISKSNQFVWKCVVRKSL